MKITSDWHIHSRNSCDSASLVVADLVREAAEKGVVSFGLTDHLHTTFNLPDIAASRREFDASGPPPHFHFGVEVSCMSQWELDEIATGRHENPVYGLRAGGPPGAPLAIGLSEDDTEDFAIAFVVGGTHWPMYVPIEREAVIQDYHRQNMFLATHPLVTIVAHPWWWMGHWQDSDGVYRTDPWFADFKTMIPKSMHNEFAAAVKESSKIVEINLEAMLLTRHYTEAFKAHYLDYVAYLQSVGVILAIGSDCHSPHYDIDFETAEAMLARVGIRQEGLWEPPMGNTHVC